ETLHAIHEINIPTIWLWPNMDAGSDATSNSIRAFREQYNPQHIHFFKNFSFEDYARLINNCKVLVGNSSSGIRESSFLGVPVVNIGTRQHHRERGKNVVDATYNREDIKSAIIKQMEIGKYEPDYIYGNGNAGKIIADNLINFELEVQKKFIAYS
ncbi:UDP-N-acetylglucosamine 2-epimerase, partial [Candidatus Pacearchaeota archaeon]|nr:UDP-N-acetylglucosamine 2-epimerase [Candidatus Pacearchaeota archaeon]